MKTGRVRYIFIAGNAGELMREVQAVTAIEGKGLEGDRYAGERGAFSKSKRPVIRQVSLIEQEAIERAATLSPNPILASETRRNIVVSNFPLNRLIGKEFMIGRVRMRGIELCDPCKRPEKLSGKSGFEEAFRNMGGLRAEILTTGVIKVGDEACALTYSCLLCGTTTLYPHVCPVFERK